MKLSKELTTVTPLSKYLAMVIFIILPIVGFFLGVRYQEIINVAERQQEESRLSILRVPTPTPIAIPTVDPSITANWQTYRNDEFGFEMRSPRSISIFVSGEYAKQSIISVKNADIFGIFVNKDDTVEGEINKLNLTWEGLDKGKIVSFAGVSAHEFQVNNREGYSRILVFSHPTKSLVFIIQIVEAFFQEGLPDQILSTFRFVE